MLGHKRPLTFTDGLLVGVVLLVAGVGVFAACVARPSVEVETRTVEVRGPRGTIECHYVQEREVSP